MPEAAVDKNRNSQAGKYDVSLTRASRSFDPEALPKSEALAVNGRPDGNLGSGIDTSVALHHRGHGI